MKKKEFAKVLRYIARSILLLLTSFWFVFALLSGSEELGGGIKGVLLNSPNALPWLVLFVFVFIAWKWELIGGILITLIGCFTIFFFDALESPFVLLAISLPIILLGGCFIGSWYLTKK
jgi:ABC-type proline/glycine betaine transport system permease subunit